MDARAPADGKAIEPILTRVREHGGRATLARRFLLGALLENPGHHSAEELAAAVQARAPHVSAKCAEISPVVSPFAYSDSTISSTSPIRSCLFFTICGSKVPSWSRGTSMRISPAASEMTWLRYFMVAAVTAVITSTLMLSLLLEYPFTPFQHVAGELR